MTNTLALCLILLSTVLLTKCMTLEELEEMADFGGISPLGGFMSEQESQQDEIKYCTPLEKSDDCVKAETVADLKNLVNKLAREAPLRNSQWESDQDMQAPFEVPLGA